MKIADVKIRREVDVSSLRPVPVERHYELISLNHDFFELELSEEEAIEVVTEEIALLEELDAAGDDDRAIVAILDARFEDPSDTARLDAGMAGVVAALTAKGAFTISSFNGNLVRDHRAHEGPNVLFACPLDLLATIDAAAATVGCGLVDNNGYLELFADDLHKMNRFARLLLGIGAAAPSNIP